MICEYSFACSQILAVGSIEERWGLMFEQVSAQDDPRLRCHHPHHGDHGSGCEVVAQFDWDTLPWQIGRLSITWPQKSRLESRGKVTEPMLYESPFWVTKVLRMRQESKLHCFAPKNAELQGIYQV